MLSVCDKMLFNIVSMYCKHPNIISHNLGENALHFAKHCLTLRNLHRRSWNTLFFKNLWSQPMVTNTNPQKYPYLYLYLYPCLCLEPCITKVFMKICTFVTKNLCFAHRYYFLSFPSLSYPCLFWKMLILKNANQDQ